MSAVGTGATTGRRTFCAGLAVALGGLTAGGGSTTPLPVRRPLPPLTTTAPRDGSHASGALKRDLLTAAEAGRSLRLPAGIYNLADWGARWRGPRQPLTVEGEPGAVLDFADVEGAVDWRISLHSDLRLHRVTLRNTKTVFAPVRSFERFELIDVRTEGVTRLLRAWTAIRPAGPRAGDPRLGRLLIKAVTAIGHGGHISNTAAWLHCFWNFDEAIFEDCEVSDRETPFFTLGYEWNPNKGRGYQRLDWPGPGHPHQPRPGFGDVFVRRCAFTGFARRGGPLNFYDTRYVNRLEITDSRFTGLDNGGHPDCEALYNKCRRGFIVNNEIVDGTNARSDGAISCKVGIFEVRDNRIVNPATVAGGTGVGIYCSAPLVQLIGNHTRNCRIDVLTGTARQHALEEGWPAHDAWVAAAFHPARRALVADHDGDAPVFFRLGTDEVRVLLRDCRWSPHRGGGTFVERFAYAWQRPKELVQIRACRVDLVGAGAVVREAPEAAETGQPLALEIVECMLTSRSGNDYLSHTRKGDVVKITLTATAGIHPSLITGPGQLITAGWQPTELDKA